MSSYQERIYQHYISSHFYYSNMTETESFALLFPFYERNYRPLLPSNHNAAILEVACGTGHFCYYLQQIGYTQVKGIDLSPEMVKFCHARGLSGVVEGDVFDYLAQYPATFDLITANDFIEHLTKPRIFDFLDAAMAALRPGGRLVLKTPNASSLFGAHDTFVDFTHEVGLTPESLNQILHAVGFAHVRILAVHPAANSWRGRLRGLVWGMWQKLLILLLTFEGRALLRPAVVTAGMMGVGQRP